MEIQNEFFLGIFIPNVLVMVIIKFMYSYSMGMGRVAIHKLERRLEG
jgi:hypothetical protein